MRIDYGPGDRIICLAKFGPDTPILSGEHPNGYPQIGEVYTCRDFEIEPLCCMDPYLHVELEEFPGWGWCAPCFKKVPKLPPRQQERERNKELEDA